MHLSDFNFTLPQELIATSPANPRDSSKLLYVADNQIIDKSFLDLADFVEEGDVVVFNNSAVISARLYGKIEKGNQLVTKIEILLNKPVNQNNDQWQIFAKPAKKLKEGTKIIFSDSLSAKVIKKTDGNNIVIKFNKSGETFFNYIEKVGNTPLPPYIEKIRKADEKDKDSYQTIYAKHKGSVAAPTAGLHFTDRAIENLQKKGAQFAYVTLHVGAGTFAPVKDEKINEHKIHSEFCSLDKQTAEKINQAKKSGNKIIAVGTTTIRTLEAIAENYDGVLQEFSGETDIFIKPGFKFKIVDKLLTNFHLPKSTLFMLISAFSGTEKMQKAYQHAITNKYRFYSYGDCCLLNRNN